MLQRYSFCYETIGLNAGKLSSHIMYGENEAVDGRRDTIREACFINQYLYGTRNNLLIAAAAERHINCTKTGSHKHL